MTKKDCKCCPMVQVVNEYKELVNSYYDLVNEVLPILFSAMHNDIPKYIVLTEEQNKDMERRCCK